MIGRFILLSFIFTLLSFILSFILKILSEFCYYLAWNLALAQSFDICTVLILEIYMVLKVTSLHIILYKCVKSSFFPEHFLLEIQHFKTSCNKRNYQPFGERISRTIKQSECGRNNFIWIFFKMFRTAVFRGFPSIQLQVKGSKDKKMERWKERTRSNWHPASVKLICQLKYNFLISRFNTVIF